MALSFMAGEHRAQLLVWPNGVISYSHHWKLKKSDDYYRTTANIIHQGKKVTARANPVKCRNKAVAIVTLFSLRERLGSLEMRLTDL